jgi:ADP-ribose pyrophosphatase YjhB (NUDIX family)
LVYLSGACIIKKRKILLLQQPSESRHANLWGPPGGHKEKDETPIETALREIKEETNLDIEITGLVEAGIKTHEDGKITVIALYSGKPKDIKNLKVDPSEVANYKWVSLEEIKKDIYPLRDPLLKPLLIKSLTQKPAPVDAFKNH